MAAQGTMRQIIYANHWFPIANGRFVATRSATTAQQRPPILQLDQIRLAVQHRVEFVQLTHLNTATVTGEKRCFGTPVAPSPT
jgi:hypothetical protein